MLYYFLIGLAILIIVVLFFRMSGSSRPRPAVKIRENREIRQNHKANVYLGRQANLESKADKRGRKAKRKDVKQYCGRRPMIGKKRKSAYAACVAGL